MGRDPVQNGLFASWRARMPTAILPHEKQLVEEARMFFSKSAQIVAMVTLVFGLLSLLSGISAMTWHWGPDEVARYGSPGKNIDRGIYTILFAVALGTLAEISFSMRKWSAS